MDVLVFHRKGNDKSFDPNTLPPKLSYDFVSCTFPMEILHSKQGLKGSSQAQTLQPNLFVCLAQS